MLDTDWLSGCDHVLIYDIHIFIISSLESLNIIQQASQRVELLNLLAEFNNGNVLFSLAGALNFVVAIFLPDKQE